MLPKITHLFRLVKDPELKFTPNGLQVCSLYLAASEKYKEKETQLFISATAFSKTAEFIATVKKGQRIFCTGKIQTESWEKDGQRQSKISMIIDSFDYVEKRDESNNGQQSNAPQAQQGFQQPAQQNQAQQNQPFEDDKNIPF